MDARGWKTDADLARAYIAWGGYAYGGGAKYSRSFHVKYTQIINRLFKTVNRVALHAHRLEILHPKTKKKMVFEAVLPQDLQNSLEILKYG